MIREIRKEDFAQLKVIHEKYYQNEFDFPDFYKNFLCAFTIVDNDDNIISTGGIRTIVESVAITDKSRTVRERRSALYELLAASQYVTARSGYEHIHAFVTDNKWCRQLIKAGFIHVRGTAIITGS